MEDTADGVAVQSTVCQLRDDCISAPASPHCASPQLEVSDSLKTVDNLAAVAAESNAQSSVSQLISDCIDVASHLSASPQSDLCCASNQETLTLSLSAQSIAQENVSTELSMSDTTELNTASIVSDMVSVATDTADLSVSSQVLHSRTGSQIVGDRGTDNSDSTNAEGTGSLLLTADVECMSADEVKPSAVVVSTPEVQSAGHSDGQTVDDKGTYNLEEISNDLANVEDSMLPTADTECMSVNEVKPCAAVVSTPETQPFGPAHVQIVADNDTINVEEISKKSTNTEDCLSSAVDAGVKASPAVASTPDSQSIRCSVVQSSLHSARQIKCRKTGHRRITANGANLSLGQLINAVSESCLDSTSSLSSAAEHRISSTPVKAGDATDRSVIKEKLFGCFDSESPAHSVISPGSVTNASCSSQGVDSVRRPPRARKSCQSNENKVASDLPKEQALKSSGTMFGSVRLAELVDAQSLDKLDGRTFDEMLLANIRNRMRPNNRFKQLRHSSEQSHGVTASQASEAATAQTTDNKTQDLSSGTPLIPASAAKAASHQKAGSSARTDAVHKQGQHVHTGAVEPPGPSSCKHAWRSRKSKLALRNPEHRVRKLAKQPREDTVPVDGEQATRRSPRSVKHSPSLDEVRKYVRFVQNV